MFDPIYVTNRKITDGDFLSHLEKIVSHHPAAVILREKDLSEEAYLNLAEKAGAICGRYGVPFIVHTFLKTAITIKAEAIHLPLPALRKMKPGDKACFKCIGASVHSLSEAKEAEALGATYLIAGHIFATDCKKDLPPRGLDFLKEICRETALPVYAIGGVSKEKIPELKRSGASGACIMSGLARCADPNTFFEDWHSSSLRFSKASLCLYAVTDRKDQSFADFYRDVENALKGGVTLVQLREKNLDRSTLIKEAETLVSLCHSFDVPLIINDDLSVALKSGADGVHLGREDMSVAEARRLSPDDFIIGATAKTVDQAEQAERDGADYLGVGAVFPSPTKKDAIRITREQLKEICSSVTIPAVAIGGIGKENIGALTGSGIDGVAVVSALFHKEDIRAAAVKLKREVYKIIL